MAQNTSQAVMARRSEPHDSLDDFPTPPWATRALFEHVLFPHWAGIDVDQFFRGQTVLEPACNRGYMLRPLVEVFGQVVAADVHDYGYPGQWVEDFLFPKPSPLFFDWIITNPPFKLAEAFIQRAFEMQPYGIAMFVRSAFLEGTGRYTRLFSKHPPTYTAQFAERVILHKGIVRDPSKEYWDETAKKMKKPSTATAYCWLVWIANEQQQPMTWIPPCRRSLERPGDYDYG